jgi:adenosylmethionine-8-amino-7-oxononanoate aminotransferase
MVMRDVTAEPGALRLRKPAAEEEPPGLMLDWHAGSDPRPVVVSGSGPYLLREDGTRLFDASGGLAMSALGNSLPADIAGEVYQQIVRVPHATTQRVVTQPMIDLAREVAAIAPADGRLRHPFFAANGTDAVEVALQAALRYHQLRGEPARTKIICLDHDFHGGSAWSVAAGGHHGHLARLAPWMPGPSVVLRAPALPPYDADVAAARDTVARMIEEAGPSTIAVMLIEAHNATTGGAVVAPPEWHHAVRELCSRHGILLLVDEITTGFGRTGLMWGMDHSPGVVPDMVTAGKGVCGGVIPLSMVLATDEVAAVIQAGPERLQVRFTAAGHAAACAGALSVLRHIKTDGLVGHARVAGEHLCYLLHRLHHRFPLHVGEPRGIGLLLALPVWQDARSRVAFPRAARMAERLCGAAMRRGLVIVGGSAWGDHLMITPYLGITAAQSGELVSLLDGTLGEVFAHDASLPGTSLRAASAARAAAAGALWHGGLLRRLRHGLGHVDSTAGDGRAPGRAGQRPARPHAVVVPGRAARRHAHDAAAGTPRGQCAAVPGRDRSPGRGAGCAGCRAQCRRAGWHAVCCRCSHRLA